MPEPDFAYRTFYTWDHSTNWDLTQPGARRGGCHEPYEKPPGAFIEDYTRLIDHMAELGLNHLIIWGALRDCHGGVEALGRLIEYGLDAGVRVAPGVGVGCYGGVYYDGEHEFSLVRLLRDRPELAAVDADGRPRLGDGNPRRSVACLRNEEAWDWTLRSIRWLMEAVEPPAVHFETGDYGVCSCERCRAAGRRDLRASDDDLAELLPPLVEEIRRHAPDCWVSYNHYTGYTREMMEQPPAFARAIPDDVICKWGVSWMLEPECAPEDTGPWGPLEPMRPDVRPPTRSSMAHLHFATGWWGCSPRGTLEIGRFLRDFPLLREVGFEGVCTHGEESALDPAGELNYHVFAALAENAAATPEQIAARSVGGLLGEEELAAQVLAAFRDERVPSALPVRVAAAAPRCGQRRVRLLWLAFELQRLAERSRQAAAQR